MYKKSVKFICSYKNEYFETQCDVVEAGTTTNPDFVQAKTIYGCPLCNIDRCDNEQCNLHTPGATKSFYMQV